MQTIYTPSGRAREYAPLALNLYESCPHGCKYCWSASMALRFGRAKSKDEWHARDVEERFGMREALRKYLRRHPGNGEPVLLCFTCDPYPARLGYWLTGQAIASLGSAGYTPIILTKGGTRACRDFDVLKAAGGWFGQTMSWWCDADTACQWEPHAALPYKRTQAMEMACIAGVNTWLSIEPVIDTAQALDVLRYLGNATEECKRQLGAERATCDHFKIGKLNGYDAETRAIEKSIDWPAYREEARRILNAAGYREITEPGAFEVGTYYVKKELREA